MSTSMVNYMTDLDRTPVFASTIFSPATVNAQNKIVEAARKAQKTVQEAFYSYKPIPFPSGVGQKLDVVVQPTEKEYQSFIIG